MQACAVPETEGGIACSACGVAACHGSDMWYVFVA